MTEYRMQRDSMGEVRLPANAYYGAQTQRAVENFPISGQRLPAELIHAIGLVKWAAASVNRDLGLLTGSGKRPLSEAEVDALLAACREVAEGRLDDQFPIDVYQTGSGTSSNMNANEVISNRAIELAGDDRFGLAKPIHPNDHVNLGQSTNDIFPTAIHVAAARGIHDRLIPALKRAGALLREKAAQWQGILKIGRTHLADATPLSLGQEIGGLARQLELSVGRADRALEAILELPAGGTAVGSGINTHCEFGARVARFLAARTGIPFVEAADHFEANAQRDGLVESHGQLRAVAVTLFNVANNIRWLGSGPRCGFQEIKIPDLQPGSSIMPGKVNPVMSESLMQAAARVIGNDQAIAVGGAAGGQFQLNIMMPMMGDVILESIRLLGGGVLAFAAKCLENLQPNPEACEASVEKSLALVTGLNPYIGYEQAAALAKEAFKTGKTIRQICREQQILPEDELAEALDPWRMTRPVA
ncbi:MAG: class II fumarate hydratase [Pirellulaceae bacterium]|nr:class II fumarate hydratase [Thermoguttaceae bacterium]MDI9445638.1 class II fumarate hydratase [Planctomycetota bacterium]NLZ00245.1 class II fumarate hydratase [Pirellulaceae bacterium]